MEDNNINQENISLQMDKDNINNIKDISSIYNDNTKLPSSTISVKEWVITLIILGIPIVGFIMLFIWAFGNDTDASKSNWAKAQLIVISIMFIISITFIVLFGMSMFSMMGRFR